MTKKNRKSNVSRPANSGSDPSVSTAVDLEMLAGVAVLVLGIAFALWAATAGWEHTLNDHHSFRQTQTAITAYYLGQQGFQLAYETPVLGKPWSIPMEFPIYQWLVSKFSKWGGWPLDQTGRAVSLIAYLAMAIPLYVLLGWARLRRSHRLAMLAMVIVSPFYLFWGRTFLVETTTLLFCVTYLAFLRLAFEKNTLVFHAGTILFGILGGLSKVTSWLPFLAAASLIIVWHWWTDQPQRRFERKALLNMAGKLLLYCGIPFLAALWWVHLSDGLKSTHPLAFTLTSANSGKWNYGTLQQKLSMDVWSIILGRAFTLFGLPWAAWSILFMCGLALTVTRRRWREVLICLALYLSAPAIFTNLHYIHDYYMAANGLFLLVAAAFAVAALLESSRTRPFGWILLLVILGAQMNAHVRYFRPVQLMPNAEVMKLADYVKKNTADDSVMITLGLDWSPLVPYYCERRALMIPEWTSVTEDQVRKALENLREEKVDLLLVIQPSRYPLERLKEQIRSLGMSPKILTISGLPQR